MDPSNPDKRMTILCSFADNEEHVNNGGFVSLNASFMKKLNPSLRNEILRIAYVNPPLAFLKQLGIHTGRLCNRIIFDFRDTRVTNLGRYYFGTDTIFMYNLDTCLGGDVRTGIVHELAHSVDDEEGQCIRRYLYPYGFEARSYGLIDQFVINVGNRVVRLATMTFFEEAFASYLETRYRASSYPGNSGNMSIAPLIFQCIRGKQYALAAGITAVCQNPLFNYLIFAQKELHSFMEQDPQTAQQIKHRVEQIEQYLNKSYGVSFQTVCNYLSQASQEYQQDSFVSVADIKRLNLDLWNNLPKDRNDIYRYGYRLKLGKNIREVDARLYLPLTDFEVYRPGILAASSYTYSAAILGSLLEHTDLTLQEILALRTSKEPGYARKEISRRIGTKLFKMLYKLNPKSSHQCKAALSKVRQHFK
jgi:hypothetical protein